MLSHRAFRCPAGVLGMPSLVMRQRRKVRNHFFPMACRNGTSVSVRCTPSPLPSRVLDYAASKAILHHLISSETMMTDRQPRLLQRNEWASHPTLWKGHVEGITLGTNVTVLFSSTEEVGRGPIGTSTPTTKSSSSARIAPCSPWARSPPGI